jgi:hypothetical protein
MGWGSGVEDRGLVVRFLGWGFAALRLVGRVCHGWRSDG